LRGSPSSAIIDGMASPSRTPPLAALSRFTAGVALALVASGGVLAQRLSRGDVRAAVVTQVIVTVATILVFQARIRRPKTAIVQRDDRADAVRGERHRVTYRRSAFCS
jgi:membrane protein implicated in regulation of membrane protease activity